MTTQQGFRSPSSPISDWSEKYRLFERFPVNSQYFLRKFSENPVFEDAHDNEVLIAGNPHRRPLRRHDISVQDFTRPLSRVELTSNLALSANRILLNIHESDFLFVPAGNSAALWRDFSRFYDRTSKALGEIIRPALEEHLFAFLETEIQLSGPWTVTALHDYLRSWGERCRKAPNPIGAAIRSARHPQDAARFFLIQLAGDYLTEASVMARNVLGTYGRELSELFKVLVDEYGNGVHEAKHSTLFESVLESVGLRSDIHAYWQFYAPISFVTNNNSHCVSKNHARFFRYLGGLHNTEVSLVSATKALSDLLRSVFGTEVDTRYFDEHTHIDRFHGEMAFDRIIAPALNRYGEAIVPEILRGFEEVRLLQEIADADLIEQIAFFDSVQANRPQAERLYALIRAGEVRADLETYVESLGERSTTHIHDDHRLLVIEQGEMDFWPRHGDPLHLVPGDVLFIPHPRLHSSVVTTERCAYHQPIVTPELAREFVGIGQDARHG